MAPGAGAKLKQRAGFGKNGPNSLGNILGFRCVIFVPIEQVIEGGIFLEIGHALAMCNAGAYPIYSFSKAGTFPTKRVLS